MIIVKGKNGDYKVTMSEVEVRVLRVVMGPMSFSGVKESAIDRGIPDGEAQEIGHAQDGVFRALDGVMPNGRVPKNET